MTIEGFDLDEWVASDFVEFFCEHMNCKPDTEVTRIEWRYLDARERDPEMRDG